MGRIVCLSVCLSVRPSVPCLNITRERKGLGSPNLAGWKPNTSNPRTYLQVKGQGHQAD